MLVINAYHHNKYVNHSFNTLMKNLLTCLSISLLLFSCKKEDAGTPSTIAMAEYYPQVIGKYITYRLDSTVFVNLNTIKEVRTYVVKDIVDATFKDNLGQDVYRIRRMMQDKNDPTVWFDNATFLVTQTARTTEFTENNLRFIKLINPVKEFTAWQGNSYIDSRDDFLSFFEGWEYFYEEVGQPFTINGKTFDETVTVNQVDDVDGDPNNKNARYEIRYSKEVYAKGLGLVYKEFLHELWQKAPINAFEPNSYGVKLTILDHN
ncbi:MAG: hypothetical protein EAZ17_03875 [Sphingobacteriales bacterium]|jgi:hypothetical protein|nr:MAG: hypothetical protein EAZ17_03875 [Sphingobacteriales bacterium]